MMGSQLSELLAELNDCRQHHGAACQADHGGQLDTLSPFAQRLPLVHGLREWTAGSAVREPVQALLDVLGSGCLKSRRQLSQSIPSQRSLLKPEQLLGLPDSVYTSAGVLYPNCELALVFSPLAEQTAEVTATPWDSGAYCKQYDLEHVSQTDLVKYREIFNRYSLPTPTYRQYLQHYVASCFVSADQYLEARDYRYADPLNLLCHRRLTLSVFEVRFRQRLEISPSTLLAVFVRRFAGDNLAVPLSRQLGALREQGVSIFEYRPAELLQSCIRRWVIEYLKVCQP